MAGVAAGIPVTAVQLSTYTLPAMMKRARAAALFLITGLALADIAGAVYLRQAWQERHSAVGDTAAAGPDNALASTSGPQVQADPPSRATTHP